MVAGTCESLKQAMGSGMRCVVTYTNSAKWQVGLDWQKMPLCRGRVDSADSTPTVAACNPPDFADAAHTQPHTHPTHYTIHPVQHPTPTLNAQPHPRPPAHSIHPPTLNPNALPPPQEFPGAERIVSDLQSGEVSVRELLQHRIVQDDRINMTVTDSGVFWSKGGM